MEHLLLVVTGRSPQVVTETLYALHHEGRAWPTRVAILTTLLGQEVLSKGHILQRQLHALCLSLGRPVLQLAEQDILLITNGSGEPLWDIRSSDEQEWLGDYITGVVRRLTINPNLAIHASIAGGRRSMSFYLGHAMTLFGRSQDRLSHVLVDEAFEFQDNFYFPSQSTRFIQVGEQLLDASQARVELSDIPFVRLRHNLPQRLHRAGTPVQVRQLVSLMNLTEKSWQLALDLDLSQCCLYVRHPQLDDELKIPLGYLEMAFYLLLCQSSYDKQPEINRSILEQAPCMVMAERVLERIALVLNISIDSNKGFEGKLQDVINRASFDGSVPERSLSCLKQGLPQHWFDSRATKLKRRLNQYLPNSVVRLLEPQQIWDQQQQPLLRWDEQGNLVRHKVKTKQGFYGIGLKPEQIHIRG